MSRNTIRSDAEQSIPAILSLEEWNRVRQSEDSREQQRVELQEFKQQNQTEFQVAFGGRPLSTQPAGVQAALEPFSKAVATAIAEREAQPRHIPPHRVVPGHSQLNSEITDEEEDLDDETVLMQKH